MKQSSASIQKSIKQFQKIIDDPERQEITKEIAYFVQHTLRWATEDTRGWPKPEDELALVVQRIVDQLEEQPMANRQR